MVESARHRTCDRPPAEARRHRPGIASCWRAWLCRHGDFQVTSPFGLDRRWCSSRPFQMPCRRRSGLSSVFWMRLAAVISRSPSHRAGGFHGTDRIRDIAGRRRRGADVEAGRLFQPSDDVWRPFPRPKRSAPSLDLDHLRCPTPARSAPDVLVKIVKLMSRLPFRITWLSVSWTKELPEEMRIAS